MILRTSWLRTVWPFGARHGGMLDVAVRSTVVEHQFKGAADISLAWACACQAKYAVVKRNWRTLVQAVFGRSLQWMNSVLEDDDDQHLSGLSSEGEAKRATLMRATLPGLE